MNKDRHRRKKDLPITWSPQYGLYENVLPAGPIFVSVYVDGRNAEAVKLYPGEQVELYDKEMRELKKSPIMLFGYLAPIHYAKKNNQDEWIIDEESYAGEDPVNPNVIATNHIHVRSQEFEDIEQVKEHLNKLDSYVTLERFRVAFMDLDTPNSWIHAIDERAAEISEQNIKQRFVGMPSEVRKRFLTPQSEK